MKRFAWIGWLIAATSLAVNASSGFAAAAAGNPLEAHVLVHTSGVHYVYHDGAKFAVDVADIGDGLIDAIPTATRSQWDSMFIITPENRADSERPGRRARC